MLLCREVEENEDKSATDASTIISEEHQRSEWEWQADSDQGLSTDGSTNGSQGTLALENSQKRSDIEIEDN